MIQSQYQLQLEIVDKIKDEGVYSGCKWCARVGIPIETVLSTLGIKQPKAVYKTPKSIEHTTRRDMRTADYDYHYQTTLTGSQDK